MKNIFRRFYRVIEQDQIIPIRNGIVRYRGGGWSLILSWVGSKKREFAVSFGRNKIESLPMWVFCVHYDYYPWSGKRKVSVHRGVEAFDMQLYHTV